MTIKNIFEMLKVNTRKVCLNCYDSFKINHETGYVTYQPYRREDFNNWSKEAFTNGKLHFYADPVDPNNNYGKYKLAEPRYVYKIEMTLTEEQYKELFEEDE
jgi:hypothetical protein